MTKKLLTLLMFLMGVLHLQAAPVEPKVSTSVETHWYLLQFLNGLLEPPDAAVGPVLPSHWPAPFSGSS